MEREVLKKKIAIRRPIADLPNTKTRTKRCIRHFTSEHYNKINWLCGCRKTSRLYCTIFSTENVWVSTGFKDMNNLLKAANRHQQSQAHIRTEICAMTFVTSRIEFQFDQQREKKIIKHNKLVKHNRKVI